jgi:glyoxylase-like metal-dependent hydrolase (beta-lactamase superfamily II)
MLVEKSMHRDWLSNAFLVAAEGGPAVFIDSGADVAPLIEAVERWGVTPVAILRTHSHHDHVVNEDELARRYSIPALAEPGEWTWDELHVKALATPGHSDDGLSFVIDDGAVATGDTLFRDAVGGGDLATVRQSVMDVLLELPDIRVWSGAEDEGSERVQVGGREATLIVWSPDYDGNGKAWVRYDDGEEATVGGSRVERNS